MNINISKDSRILLEKLSKIHDRSMTNCIEYLLKKEGTEYGLIESRK